MKFLVRGFSVALSALLLSDCKESLVPPTPIKTVMYHDNIEKILTYAVQADYAAAHCGQERRLTSCDIVPDATDCRPAVATVYIAPQQACDTVYQLQAAQVVYAGMTKCKAEKIDSVNITDAYRTMATILAENKVMVVIEGDDDSRLRNVTVLRDKTFTKQLPAIQAQISAIGETRLNIAFN